MVDNAAPNNNIHTRILVIWDLLPAKEAMKRFEGMLQELPNVNLEATSEETVNKTWLGQIYRGQILTQLARTQGLLGRFNEAHMSLDEAEKIAKDVKRTSTDSSLIGQELAALNARVELERGRVVNSLAGDSASSVQCFKNALSYASPLMEGMSVEELADRSPKEYSSRAALLQYLAVDSLHMLAIVQGSKEEKEESTRRGLEIAEREAGDSLIRRWVGPLLNNTAWDALEYGDFERAVSVFQRAEEVRKEALDDLEREEWYSKLTDADKTTIKEKRILMWKTARWSVGHAKMVAGKEDEAVGTLTGILNDGLDGPAIRADLAILVAKQGDSNAVEHARRAISLGVSKEKVADMNAIIARFNI